MLAKFGWVFLTGFAFGNLGWLFLSTWTLEAWLLWQLGCFCLAYLLNRGALQEAAAAPKRKRKTKK
jgi:hypothetical protein